MEPRLRVRPPSPRPRERPGAPRRSPGPGPGSSVTGSRTISSRSHPRRLAEVQRTRERVDECLIHEENGLFSEAIAAQEKERAGHKPQESSDSLFRKAQDLQARRETRLALLDRQAQLTTKPPRIMTAALVLPVAMVEAEIAGDAPNPGQGDEGRRAGRHRAGARG